MHARGQSQKASWWWDGASDIVRMRKEFAICEVGNIIAGFNGELLVLAKARRTPR